MIKNLGYFLFKKQIILFEPHRHISPIINSENKRYFIFINVKYLWLLMTIFGRKKLRSKAMFNLIDILNPEYIFSINWISKRQLLYFLWAKKRNKNFVVVQHGSYVGGKISDVAHKYSKCTIMWCWSNYFKNKFEENNNGKNVTFINYGNTVYNMKKRQQFNYISGPIKKILFLPTFMKEEKVLKEFKKFVNHIISLGCCIHIKEHTFQKLFNPLSDRNIIDQNIYELLNSKNYDLVISDHSSSLLDAIFFKKRVLYFNSSDYHMKNIYEDYLTNIYDIETKNISLDLLETLIDINGQEKLFNKLAGGFTENNKINFK